VPDSEREQPLSPELVLVSPDLRERACAEEPEPGTQPGTPTDVAPPAVVPLSPRPVAPPPSATPAAPPTPAMPAGAPDALLSTQTTEARVEWRLTVGAATVLALSALLVFGAGVAVGQLAVPGSTTRSPATQRSAQGRQTASALMPVATVPAPTTAPPAANARRQKAKPSAAATRARSQPSKTVLPANAGYAFFDGHFQLSSTGRAILGFTARTTCAGPLELPSIEVSPARTFGFSGHPAGSLPGTTVHLTGRFPSRAEARGTLQVTRNTCRAPATPFVAHLS
jgi:hypothetical protein